MDPPLSSSFRSAAAVGRHLVTDRQELGSIAARAERLAAMKIALWPEIPADLRDHCDLANVRNGVVVMTAHSPVWAARLRQAGIRILHTVRKTFQIRAERLEIRVSPPRATREERSGRRELSPAARQALERAAAASADPALRAAIERVLAR